MYFSFFAFLVENICNKTNLNMLANKNFKVYKIIFSILKIFHIKFLLGISEVTAMINTKYSDPREDNPDIQLIFGGYLADCAETGMVGEKKGANRTIYVIPTLLHPKSRGYLRLRSNDPLSKPMIYPKYLTHPDDVAGLIEGIKFSIQLAETRALKK